MPSSEPRTITSLTNERIKAIRALEMRKERKATGLFVAEGMSILITARDMGAMPTTLVTLAGRTTVDGPTARLARGLVAGARAAGADCLEVSTAVLQKLSGKDNPQTMLAVYRQRWAEPPQPEACGPDDVWLALEEVRDPGNLGTIVRTVDAFGVRGIVLVGASADPYAREAVRATMGSIFAVPLVRMTAEAFLALATRWRAVGDVVGTHLDGAEDVRAATSWRRPALVVMGSEGPGLSVAAAAVCTRRVRIPMAGRLDSLNLAVATAVTLFEVRRDRL
jgi:TrmH family RNA methyltransferase